MRSRFPAVLAVLVLGLIPGLALAQAAMPTDEKGLEELVKKEPKNPGGWFRLAVLRQKAGKLGPAAEAYEKASGLGFKPVAEYNLATVRALQGDNDRAFKALENAVNAGFAKLDDMDADPDLAKLRADPRWAEQHTKLERVVYPCKQDPIHRQLDFWVGEWDVYAPAGYKVGQSSVQSILGGCVVFENWTSNLGGQGKSFNFYDPGKKLWQQTYIDSTGTVLEITGGLQPDGSLRYQSDVLGADGKKGLQRLTFTPLKDGRVRQFWEQSPDAGKTWKTLFEGFYQRKK